MFAMILELQLQLSVRLISRELSSVVKYNSLHSKKPSVQLCSTYEMRSLEYFINKFNFQQSLQAQDLLKRNVSFLQHLQHPSYPLRSPRAISPPHHPLHIDRQSHRPLNPSRQMADLRRQPDVLPRRLHDISIPRFPEQQHRHRSARYPHRISGKLGLVNPKGTVCRVVDFAPGYECMMHRTQSLDFGVVLEGKVEMLLDSGDTTSFCNLPFP